MASHKKLFWISFALVTTGFFYYKLNYTSNFPKFLPASPWINGWISFFHIDPTFGQELFKSYLGLGVGSLVAIFIITLWGLKK